MESKNHKAEFKKWSVIALFVAAAILSAVFMGKVAINYNLADYLGKDTQTKIALDIITTLFIRKKRSERNSALCWGICVIAKAGNT